MTQPRGASGGRTFGSVSSVEAFYSMSDPVRIGVIGVGFGQQVHVPAFRTDARCQVVAICAQTSERAERVARQLGVREVYGEAHEMLARGQVDAVSIVVPPSAQ